MPDRIEREIEDILSRIDDFLPEERRARRIGRRVGSFFASAAGALRDTLSRFSPGTLMLAALAAFIAALVIDSYTPTLARYMIIASVAVFLGALVLSLVRGASRGGNPRIEKRWRGQAIDYGEPTIGDRLRSWWQNKSRRQPRGR